MNKKKILGWFMVSIPFVTVFSFLLYIKPVLAFITFGGTAVVLCLVIFGIRLIDENEF